MATVKLEPHSFKDLGSIKASNSLPGDLLRRVHCPIAEPALVARYRLRLHMLRKAFR